MNDTTEIKPTKPKWMDGGVFGGSCFKRDCMRRASRAKLAAYGLVEICARCLRDANAKIYQWPEHVEYARMFYMSQAMEAYWHAGNMDFAGRDLLIADLMSAEAALRDRIMAWLDEPVVEEPTQ